MRRFVISVLVLLALASWAGGEIISAPSIPGTPRPTNPQIVSVTPGFGSPGDNVVIKAINVPLDKTKAEVWFTIAANKSAQGTISRSAESRGQVTYWVQVPGDESITAQFRGPLYIKVKGTGRVTPSIQFSVIPVTPKITSHSPQYGAPGRTTTFKGVNFKPDDQVSVNVVGTVPMVYRSATEIAITLPSNFPTTESLIRVTVRRKNSSTTQVPSPYMYALDPAVNTGERPSGNTGQKVEPKEEGGSK